MLAGFVALLLKSDGGLSGGVPSNVTLSQQSGGTDPNTDPMELRVTWDHTTVSTVKIEWGLGSNVGFNLQGTFTGIGSQSSPYIFDASGFVYDKFGSSQTFWARVTDELGLDSDSDTSTTTVEEEGA